MFKKGFYTLLMAMLFATPAVFAHDHGKDNGDKDKQEQTDAQKQHEKAVEEAKDADTAKHPAHEMGEGDPAKEQGK